jgi:hypothetical protein
MHLTPRQLAELRSEFAKGGLEASLLAAQLLEIVEKLQAQLQAAEAFATQSRRAVAAEEAAALSAHLATTAAAGKDCPSCHDGEARAAVARLREIADGGREEVAPAPPEREARRRGAGQRV